MENKERFTWSEAKELMWKFNEEHGYATKGCKERITVIAVITPESFDKPYTEIQRSYAFTNDNKAFLPNQCSNSIFSYCLDGTDDGVRLDWYVPKEWKVDYCYIMKEGA